MERIFTFTLKWTLKQNLSSELTRVLLSARMPITSLKCNSCGYFTKFRFFTPGKTGYVQELRLHKGLEQTCSVVFDLNLIAGFELT